MKRLFKYLAIVSAFDAIFCNDAHEIVSAKGLELLNENKPSDKSD